LCTYLTASPAKSSFQDARETHTLQHRFLPLCPGLSRHDFLPSVCYGRRLPLTKVLLPKLLKQHSVITHSVDPSSSLLFPPRHNIPLIRYRKLRSRCFASGAHFGKRSRRFMFPTVHSRAPPSCALPLSSQLRTRLSLCRQNDPGRRPSFVEGFVPEPVRRLIIVELS